MNSQPCNLTDSNLAQRYHIIKDNLPTHITLLCVSKTHNANAIKQLYCEGQRDFGENYLQEALGKQSQLKDLSIIWHYIGHIQRNKTKQIAQAFDWVHTLERAIIAERLSEQRQGLPPLNVLIQVNIDNEDSKSGCMPNEVLPLALHILTLPNLVLRGLMIIPSKGGTNAFDRTQVLFNELASTLNISTWDTLSMGMSGDMHDAIACGSTMVRVGTAIFGQRR